ncbi:DEAD/DEAH box helicase family protein [Leptolyngbya sp. FACHB-711]|uniref:DEAD/DEAH box helicase family protein n=1 Tax=Leptolyngbya sp. FACHB-711 TaxID=2692813 RepID=UPI00168957DC|nr:DEAD/DEAH box helicase family protein [Leptolyngbya sp. FACHB-711]MBD2025241.1 DEAD/DEAH box helicase family protein [Leptolyngbya sp. FACHB-711]
MASLSKAVRLKRECPICEGARRDCRKITYLNGGISSEVIHCRSEDANPIGYTFTRIDRWGFGMWIRAEEAEKQQQKNQRPEKQQRQEQAKNLLSIPDRNRQYKAVARHSGLSLEHRRKLADRGLLTEQIEAAYSQSLLWTWQGNSAIPGVTSELPGADGNGRLRKFGSGLAIGVPNQLGQILGAQIRADKVSSGGNRYFWISSSSIGGNGIELPSGEIPIGYYLPVQETAIRDEINLAEGFLKPHVIAQKFGVLCLGASGGNFPSSSQQLASYLKAASQATGSNVVVLNADAGSVKNAHVLEQYRQTHNLVVRLGYEFRVRWWGQVQKTAGDADEIDAETFNNAQLLTIEEFEAIAQQHEPKKPSGGFGQLAEQPANSEQQERLRLIQKRRITFQTRYWEMLKRDFLLTATDGRSIEYYEGFCKQFSLHAPTVLLRGWLGSGKTEATLRSLLARREYLSKQILLIVPRNGLGRQTAARAARLGFPEIRHVQDDNSENRDKLRRGEPGLYVLCPDSLKDYAVGEVCWADTIVVLDEFAGMRSEILSKSAVMPEFERLLSECWRLIAVDAFLSDADARILSRYRKGQRLILNQKFQQSPKPVFWLEQLNKKGMVSLRHDGIAFALIDQWAAEGVKSIAVASDSLTALKAVVARMKQHGMDVHVCSSETPEENALFMPDPDGYLQASGISSIAFSPTAQSGLDVQTHFDKGLLLCSGVLPPPQMLQKMGRARQCQEWYVSCPRFVQDSPISIRALDNDRVKQWGIQLQDAFTTAGVQHSDRTHGWGLWQSAVDEVAHSFNSEYLQMLLEHFFERVETLEIKDAPVQEWRDAIEAVKQEDARQLINGNLGRGLDLLKAQKAPVFNSEVWDVRLAQLHDKYPEVVNDLIALANDEATDQEQLINLVRIFKSSRLDRIKFWVMATEPNEQDDGAILALLRDKFTCAKSAKLRAFRNIRLFRSLNLGQLAQCSSTTDDAVADRTHFHAGCEKVQELYAEFQKADQLRQFFPQVEDLFSFWAIVRQCMRFMGYQGCGKAVRVATEELHPNGCHKDGRRRYSKSKVVYMNGWLDMECSGNKLFQQIFWADIIPAIRNRLSLERSRRAEHATSPPEELIAA